MVSWNSGKREWEKKFVGRISGGGEIRNGDKVMEEDAFSESKYSPVFLSR